VWGKLLIISLLITACATNLSYKNTDEVIHELEHQEYKNTELIGEVTPNQSLTIGINKEAYDNLTFVEFKAKKPAYLGIGLMKEEWNTNASLKGAMEDHYTSQIKTITTDDKKIINIKHNDAEKTQYHILTINKYTFIIISNKENILEAEEIIEVLLNNFK